MLKKMVAVILLVFTAVLLNGQSINDVKFNTEEYPPFNFKEKGELKGITIEILDAVLKEMGASVTTKDVKLLPWARGYDNALKVKNTCLFATTRTPKREKEFKWVGPIVETKVGVIAKKSSKIKINNTDDFKKYKIGVIRDDIGQQLLEGIGITNLEKVADNVANIKKLNINRINLVSYEITGAFYKIKQMGFSPSDYEVVYSFKESQLYYAFQKDTPDKIIKEMQKALDKVRKKGKLQKIVDSYMK